MAEHENPALRWSINNAADVEVSRFESQLFFQQLVCYFSTGVVIIVFVFDDVIDGLKMMAFNSRIAFLRLSYEAQLPVRIIIKTMELQSPDVVDEEGARHPRLPRATADVSAAPASLSPRLAGGGSRGRPSSGTGVRRGAARGKY